MVDRDRRYLAKNCLSLGIGIGGVVGAELWARRFGNPLYDISPETDLDIKNRAETIVPYLSFENFEREYPMGDKRVRIVPNQEEISRDILRLAYKDGGQTYYERIQNLLKESGLIIRMSDLTAMGLAGVYTKNHTADTKPIIELNPHILIDPQYRDIYDFDTEFSHEVWHYLQHKKELPESTLAGASNIAGILATAWWMDTQITNHVTRRKFVQTTARLVLLLAAAAKLKRDTKAQIEGQAYRYENALDEYTKLSNLFEVVEI